MAVNEVARLAYGVPVDALAQNSSAGASKDAQEAAHDAQVAQVLKKLADKNIKQSKENTDTQKTERPASENKAESLFKGLLDGKAGKTGKETIETFKEAALSKFANSASRQELGETTERSPQAGFAAASSFKRMSDTPGADKALGQSAIASELVQVTTQSAKKGPDELKKLEGAVGEFVKAFGHDDATPTVKKKVFGVTAREPGSERHQAGVALGGHKGLKLMNAGAQEGLANKLVKGDPKNIQDTLKGLSKFVDDPKLLSPKMSSSDMKANFSNLTKAVTGGEKLGISLEAQEKILSSSKFHAMGTDARGKIQLAVGRAPHHADGVMQTLQQVRPSRTEKFAAKLAQRGTDPETCKQLLGEMKTRETPFPPIEKFDPNNPRPQKQMIAFQAKWNRVAQQVDKHNAHIGKQLNKVQSMRQLNDLDVPRGFGPVIGTAKNAQELAEKLECSPEEAEYIWKLHERCESYKNDDLKLSKQISMKKRTCRGKQEPRGHLKEKRAAGASMPKAGPIVLNDAATTSTASLKKMLSASGVSTKTAAPDETKDSESTTATPLTKEQIAAKNTHSFKASGTSMSSNGSNMAAWGKVGQRTGLDKETRIKELAKRREATQDQLKNDKNKLTKGPLIGRASDFTSLNQIVADKTPWVSLAPAMKAALRNLQITPNILDSWQTSKPIYSQVQTKSWGELKEIQWKSAQLIGLTQPNWDALAGELSRAMDRPREKLAHKTEINLTKVTSKGAS